MSNFLFDGMEERLPAGVNFGKEEHPLIVAWGMGVNSTAMLCGFAEKDIKPDLILAADTGGEKPETYAYIDTMKDWLDRVGFPDLILVGNDGIHGTLEQECLTNGTLPSKAYGYSKCADKYKIRPQNKYVAHWQPALEAWERGGACVQDSRLRCRRARPGLRAGKGLRRRSALPLLVSPD